MAFKTMDPTKVRLSPHFLLSDFPETWVGIPGMPSYQVSTLGCVRRLGRGRNEGIYYLLYPGVANTGYRKVTLREKGKRIYCKVAYLVALAFIGERPTGMEVCHNDGVRTNDRKSNLRYGTHVENMQDKALHGTQPRGARSHLAKTTEEVVRTVRRLVASGRSKKVVARRYGLKIGALNDICARRTWKDSI